MTRNVRRTATPWRRRYLVNVWHRQKVVEVLLVRGRVKRTKDGDHHVMISPKRDGKWTWYVLPDGVVMHNRSFFEAADRDMMLARVTVVRLGGYTLLGTVPSW